MAFARPTLSEIVERAQSDLVSRLDLSTPILRRAVSRVLARVIAGAAHMLHGHLEFLSRQIFPDQAEREYLVRWGALFGLAVNAASFAAGNVKFTGTNTTVVPAGTVLRRADGAEYTTAADVTIAAGEAIAVATATAAGEDGNCAAADELTFESPIAGVNATAVVQTGGLGGGADEETTDEFRARVLERMQSPPHGGNAADYVAWAKEVPGVTRAWCYPLEGGPGTVTVRFVRDNDSGLLGYNMIPSSGEVTTVQAYLDGLQAGTVESPRGGGPEVTAVITVAAPVAAPVNFTLQISPDTTVTRAAVGAALLDLLERTSSPGGILPLSQIEVAVGTASGVTDFAIALPAANVVNATGEMSTMGLIEYT